MIEPADEKERFRALTDFGSTLLVEAAAGTGKTALIAGRVALALMSGVQPRELVAITFTQAAADELSIRINKYVTDLLQGRIPDCLLRALPTGPSAAQLDVLAESFKSLDELTVTTIHGFCQKLISSYAVEADIDPGARMMDGPQAESAFNTVFKRWIRHRLTVARGSGDLIAALSRDDPGNVVNTLKSLASFRLKHRTARAPSANLSARLDVQLAEAVDAFRHWTSEVPAEPETAALVAELEQLAEFYNDCLASTPHFSRLWTLAHPPRLRCMWDKSSDLKRPRFKNAWQRVAGKQGAQFNELAESFFTRVNVAYTSLYGRIATALCEALSHEISEVLDAYARFKRDAAVLDFDDLLHRARSMVRDHEAVRGALGKRYRQIMVDEFQDTDPLQAEILFRIAAVHSTPEWEQCTLRPGALFMVGDPKQAIYRFRGADIDSYRRAQKAVERQWPDNTLQITANFRSVPPILTYINERFGKLLEEPGQPGYVSLTPVRECADLEVPNVAKRTLDLQPDCKAKEFREVEAAEVASLCARLIGNLLVPDSAGNRVPLGPEGIALLTPNYVELWRYERALEAQGLPFASRAAKSLFRRQEVQDVLALVRTLADPKDTLAFGAFLRGPLVGLTEQELLDISLALHGSTTEANHFTIRTEAARVEHARARAMLVQLQALRGLAGRTTPALLLAEAVERLNLRPLLAAREGNRRSRAIANVERFLELAKSYDTAGIKQFAQDMSKEWGSRRDERVEGRVDSDGAIELVTMHSSKGLEWPVVILINTVGQVSKRSEFVHRGSDDTIHWILRDVEPPELASALEEDGRISESERQRVMYVACSRARDVLVIPQGPSRSYPAWSSVLPGACNDIPELCLDQFPISPQARRVEARNGQTSEVFAEEQRRVVRATRGITWVRPSDYDEDRLSVIPSLIAEETPLTTDIPGPVGAGRTRGLVLHKLVEEVLTAEIPSEFSALSHRADELVRQLLGGRTDAVNAPESAELAQTVLKTLALPEIAAMPLVPEIAIFGLQSADSHLEALTGRADALVLDGELVSVVVDWKSDVAPTNTDKLAHAGQLLKYMGACGAPRGALVYMTSGTIQWVEPSK